MMEKGARLLAFVREALAKDLRLRSCLDSIRILVNDDTVSMTGSVTDEALKTHANMIVSSLPGVKRLIDDLRVDPRKARRLGVQIDWHRGIMTLK